MSRIAYLQNLAPLSFDELSQQFKAVARLELSQHGQHPMRVWTWVSPDTVKVSWVVRGARECRRLRFRTPHIGGRHASGVFCSLRRALRLALLRTPEYMPELASPPPLRVNLRSQLFTGVPEQRPLELGEAYDSIAAAEQLMEG